MSGVPDVVTSGLDVLFVGINPGLASARAGHHFANPANGFWRLLHEAGFTPRLFAPHEDRLLPEHGLGITNLVSRSSAGVADLGREEMLKGAEALGRNLERWRPRAIVFVGFTAWGPFARRWRLKAASRAGRQPGRFAGAQVFVLPNPSGRNAHFSRAEMRALYRRAAHALRRR